MAKIERAAFVALNPGVFVLASDSVESACSRDAISGDFGFSLCVRAD